MTRLVLGFDRKLTLPWLDAAAELASGASDAALRRQLRERLLAGGLGKTASGKTATVLAHVWGAPTPTRGSLRKGALQLWADASASQRVALHWGMAVSSYPFFRDIADVVGRLLGVQESVGLAQVERRIVERWGDRSTVRCAAGRAVHSMRTWGCLAAGPRRGVFARAGSIDAGRPIALWLLEATLEGLPGASATLSSLLASPVLYPFALGLSPADVRRGAGLVVEREGLDAEIVTRRSSSPPPPARQRRGSPASGAIEAR